MLQAILIIIPVVVALRLLLPHVGLFFINRNLRNQKKYPGRIKRLTINLVRSTVTLHETQISKVESKTYIRYPFFSAPMIHIKLRLGALLKKSLIADIKLDHPQLEFNKEQDIVIQSKDQVVKKSPSNFKTLLQGVKPFSVNLEVDGGKVRYTDPYAKPPVDITVTDLNMDVKHFSNMEYAMDKLPAKITASAGVYEGTFSLSMDLSPMADHPTFDLNAELKSINMVLLNDFFRAYARIDVNRGSFGMYTEITARDGEFKGYVKPVIHDLDIIGAEDRNDNLFRKLWEGLVAGVFQVLKNKDDDQIASKVPFSGKLDDPHVNIFVAAGSILRNAFIHALQPSIDDVIGPGSIVESATNKAKGFLKGLIGK